MRQIAGYAALLVLTVLALVGITSCIRNNYAAECARDGGHLSSHSGYKSVTYFCLTPDGRVLWIR